jgi:FKBP-type peptidyl-prolyl cis-trans isomerase 2
MIMHQAHVGDRVRVEYVRVRTSNSEATKTRVPRPKLLEFTVGGPEVMPGLSRGVTGMSAGDNKRLHLQPSDAFGPSIPCLIREIPRKQFPKRIRLRVGKKLSAVSKHTGRRRVVRVVKLEPGVVVVDGNHPLAGRAVVLDVRLISVDASAEANRSRPQFDVGGES